MQEKAIQDYIVGNHCFGCGPENAQGLQIKSHWDGKQSTCTFAPKEHHCAGPENVLNGGIIATIIDCHGVCTASAYATEKDGIEDGAPPVMCVTGSLHIDYLRPTPIVGPIEMVAHITEDTGKKIIVHCDLTAGGKPCATGTVVAVRVPLDWKADS